MVAHHTAHAMLHGLVLCVAYGTFSIYICVSRTVARETLVARDGPADDPQYIVLYDVEQVK
jgi:hypothetical protein